MYIIGDATCARKVKMWEDVIGILRSRDQIRTTLRLQCVRHLDKVLQVDKPADFEMVAPEGGCKELCGQRLNCGHSCEFLCHAEIRHRVAPCRKPCERGRPDCGHRCPKPCSEPCGKCAVPIMNVALNCGHSLASVPCWVSHDLTRPEARCKTRIVRKLPRCGHEAEMPCCLDPEKFPCQKRCGGVLSCRHTSCNNVCSSCTIVPTDLNDPPYHAKPCQQRCDRPFTTCSHLCRRPCHSSDDCGTCMSPCQLGCIHSKCGKICGQACVPCAEPCTWNCEHLGQCNMPCGAPCDRLPCNQRCGRTLPCGHRCPSVCGEKCPDSWVCEECSSASVKEKVVDFVEFATYDRVDVNENPVIVLSCQHFYTMSFLDRCLEIDSAYVRNENGQFTQSIQFGNMTFDVKRCPECKEHISGIQRYNRVLKRAVLDVMLRTLIVQAQVSYSAVSSVVDKFELHLESSRTSVLNQLQRGGLSRQRQPISAHNAKVISERMHEFDQVRSPLQQYTKDVAEGNQPHVRVYGMSIAARDRAKTGSSASDIVLCPLDIPSPDIKHRLLGDILRLRLDAMQYTDMLQLVDHLSRLDGCESDATPLYKDIVKKCDVFCANAEIRRSESEQRQYHGLTVEILLLQVQFISLLLRGCQSVAPSRTVSLRSAGLQALSRCKKYFERYASCRKYESAAERAGEMLQSLAHFYQAVSVEERRAIVQAMNADFHGTGHWYRCGNGHPVIFH